MVNWALIGGIGFCLTVIIGIVVTITVLNAKKSSPELKYKEMGGENPTILVSLKKHDSGHAFFKEHKVDRVGFNSPSLSHCTPLDIQINGDRGGDRASMDVELRFGAGSRIDTPIGTVSDHRNVAWGMPYHEKDLSPDLKGTFLGIAAEQYIFANRHLQPFIAAQVKGGKTTAELMEVLNSGEISREMTERFGAMGKVWIDLIAKQQLRPENIAGFQEPKKVIN